MGTQGRMNSTQFYWLLLLPVAAINVFANILLKIGSADPRAPLLLNILSWRSFLGLACFGLGGVAYAFLLRFVPLSTAQAVLASQYIFTILGAWLLLHETITIQQALGFLFIGIGIGFVVIKP